MRRTLVAFMAAFLFAACGGDSPSTEEADTSTATPEAETAPAKKAEAYSTSAFLGGEMKVTLPNDWIVSDDSSAHFAAAEQDDPDYRVLFSLDAYAVRKGKRVNGVRSTTEGLLAWLRANQNVRVMPKPERPIGNDLPARVVDISTSDKAVNDDPGCPEDVCVNPIAFPPSGEVYGLAGDGVIRLYLSDIKYQERKHLLVISIEGKDWADLNAFLPGAERLIASVQAPVIPE